MGRPETKMNIITNCKQCGTAVSHKPYIRKMFCSQSCRCTFVNKSRAKEKEKRSCLICNRLFEVTPQRKKYCSMKCWGIARRKPESEKVAYVPKPPRIKYCGVCGAEFIAKGATKFCLTCRETEKLRKARESWKTEQYKESHRRGARRWQKNHPNQQKAANLAKSHPERLKILYECPCNVVEKHRHHPDYSKPFEVLILCDVCHRAEHKRLRLLAAQSANNSSTPAVNASAEDSGTMAAGSM